MRRTTLGHLFITAGVVLGVAVAVGVALGIQPRLSPFLVKVAVFKLAFFGAVGLIAAGAFLRRWARRDRVRQ